MVVTRMLMMRMRRHAAALARLAWRLLALARACRGCLVTLAPLVCLARLVCLLHCQQSVWLLRRVLQVRLVRLVAAMRLARLACLACRLRRVRRAHRVSLAQPACQCHLVHPALAPDIALARMRLALCHTRLQLVLVRRLARMRRQQTTSASRAARHTAHLCVPTSGSVRPPTPGGLQAKAVGMSRCAAGWRHEACGGVARGAKGGAQGCAGGARPTASC